MTQDGTHNPSLHYQSIKDSGLSLDLTRGKPSPEQLDLSNDLLTLPGLDYLDSSGVDSRNYGGLDGLPEMKKLFSDILEVEPGEVIVAGNSSLTLMASYLGWACLFGLPESDAPWSQENNRKFICPVPGYDRHFGITEHLGFELISVDMTDDGPDMDQVESIAASDASVKGIWCVPKYSNPTGACYSDETVYRLAVMKTAARDFRILWDNAYAEHHLTDSPPSLANILEQCRSAGNENRVLEFASTSKMTFPGAGVSALAAGSQNIAWCKKHIGAQSIGPDKINQLRHLQLIPDLIALRAHMEQHRQLVKPKFDRVIQVLEQQLGDSGIARWTNPKGGYFISLDVQSGSAERVIQLAAEAGVALTSAGAPFPYGNDPQDCNIRIAPTFASVEDVESATRALCACILLADSENPN
jgi:DNA-binding transcriptional MocR family regulator